MADTLDKEFDDNEIESSPEGEEKPIAPELSTASSEERDTQDKESTFLEIASFLKKYSAAPPVRGRKDMVDDRYIIRPNNLIGELSNDLSAACEAGDDNVPNRNLYALMLPKEIPYRLRHMELLAGYDHPNLLTMVAAGNVQYSQDDKCRMAAVYEKPPYRTVRQVLQNKKSPFTERFAIDEIITPLVDLLLIFRENNIAHGSINLDTVYLGDKVLLGECVSQPAGYAQHFHFESPERSQAMPLGKGEANITADCYALGILVLHLILGLRFFERIEERQYLNKRLTLGTYNTLVGGREFKSLEDFLKGVLNDDANERWSPSQIDQWIKGKKYNLLTPSVLREGQRPFQFLEQDYFNRRSLAHNLAENWEESKTVLRNNHLSRWVEVSLHKNEMAEAIRKVMEKTGGIHGISEKANNELVARTVCLLDPEGPVRYNMLSSFVDGLGVELASAMHERDQKRIQACVEILDYNLFNYVNDLLEGAKSKRYGNLLWRMQSCSRYLRVQAMGFGIERILYELNPTLACQSPLLIDENVLTIEGLLQALDRMGNKSKNFEYLDRHIAAFIATRMDMSKEVKLTEIKRIPALAQNPQLIVIYMLAQAQRKSGKLKLKGLSSWAALRVVPLIDNFHSRSIRRKLRASLKNAARSGDLDKIFECLMDQSTVLEDLQGFQKAVQRFTKNAKHIAKLENKKRLRGKAELVGMILAQIVAYSTLLITTGVVLKKFFFGS
jgi:hypothetical protein